MIKPVAGQLDFPTGIALDPEGSVYVCESGLSFAGLPCGGRILRIAPDGSRVCLLDGLRAPVNGVVFHQGSLFISEGGNPGRIIRFSLARGEATTLVDDLPGFGNYHTNMAVIGPDGRIYFSQGSMTNSGIIGLDSNDLGWLQHVRHNCDIPAFDLLLAGVNAETPDPVSSNGHRVSTGAFSPFGTATRSGDRIMGRVPCTSAVMRCNLDGSGLEVVAWGLRNAYGLRFAPDGRLLATDQGADDRGSRPIYNCPDFLFEIRAGAWYGWPDYMGGVPVTDARFRDGGGPQFLLANHDELPAPERALLEFQTNVCATKFDFAPREAGPWEGHLLVALFGDERPITARPGPRAGRCLVRVDPTDWSVHPVATPPLHRPIDVMFISRESSAYVLDFGEFEITPEKKVQARPHSGSLWKFSPDSMEA